MNVDVIYNRWIIVFCLKNILPLTLLPAGSELPVSMATTPLQEAEEGLADEHDVIDEVTTEHHFWPEQFHSDDNYYVKCCV